MSPALRWLQAIILILALQWKTLSCKIKSLIRWEKYITVQSATCRLQICEQQSEITFRTWKLPSQRVKFKVTFLFKNTHIKFTVQQLQSSRSLIIKDHILKNNHLKPLPVAKTKANPRRNRPLTLTAVSSRIIWLTFSFCTSTVRRAAEQQDLRLNRNRRRSYPHRRWFLYVHILHGSFRQHPYRW